MKRYSDFTRQLFVAAIFSSLILIAACDKEQNHKEKSMTMVQRIV